MTALEASINVIKEQEKARKKRKTGYLLGDYLPRAHIAIDSGYFMHAFTKVFIFVTFKNVWN